MTDIILKRGTGVPSDTDLEVAEVAIDSSSGAMYTKLADGSVKQLNEGGASDWESITGKPTEFPPASHDHDGVYQPVGDYIGEAPTDGGEYVRQNSGWAKLENHNYTGADAVKLTGDQSVAGHKTWTGVATFGDTVTMRGTLNGDDTANFQNAVTAGSFVKSGGTSSEYLMADGSVSSGSTGGGSDSSVRIGEAPPADPQEGQQWMEVPADGDATMWIYDSGNGGQWLQHPSGGGGSDIDTSQFVLITGDQEIDGVKTFTQDIVGKANVYGYFGSDERLKDEISSMPIGLIDAVIPCVWKWKSGGRSSGGVIAQQLQKIGLDDWVREAPNGDLGVDSMALIGMLIAEVQDLKRRLSDG